MIRAIVGIALAAAPASFPVAQDYPVKPVRLVVPYLPGGPSDLVARLVGQKLAEGFGKQIVVENRAGANGNIGLELVVRSPADGYTIVVATGFTLTVNPLLYRLPYDVLRDLQPISLLNSSAAVMAVHPTLPAKSVQEFIALARRRPGELSFGSSGIGGFGHISGEMFKMMSGTRMEHVPYKSSAPALADVIGGHVPMLFNNLVTTVPVVRQGKLTALGVTSRERSHALPEVPTLAEAGLPHYESTTWIGLLAPAGVPREIVARVHAEVGRGLRQPDVRDHIERLGAVTTPSSPEAFRTRIVEDTRRMGEIVRFSGMKPE